LLIRHSKYSALLIRHSKYSAMLPKMHPTDCFFGDFAISTLIKVKLLRDLDYVTLYPKIPLRELM